MDDWQKIRLHIPAENEIYHAPPSERQRLVEKAEDDITREALELMDGSRTLRQVMGKLPYSRFDACRCLAALIAEKKVKPLDGTSLGQFARGDSDPKQVIACLKTILEREPNNREILKKLADVQEAQGQRDESAMCNKLLAISHLEEGDLGRAEEHLRRSLALSPKDLVTWQKLWDVVKRSSDQRKMLELSAELTAHFRALGLMEVVRDHLMEAARLFPDQLRVKLDLCDAQYALGEHKAAVQGLFEIGRVLLRKRRFDEAEKLFARILKYDRDNSKARDVYEKLRSGKLVKRQAFRQKLFQVGALALFIAFSTVYLIYDIQGRGKLFEATRGVFADSLLENRRYDEAITRIREVEESHPFSLTASYEVPRLLETLLRKQKETSPGAQGRQPRAPQPPPKPANAQAR
jgi:tetratricopeptide (TPR) repeat protein